MADRNQYQPSRRSDSDFWTERTEEGDREGDPSEARNYDRNDMRDYARRSVEQGDRLRRSRGEPQRGESGGSEGETGDYGHQREWDERELYRGYGTTIAQRSGRDVDPDIERQRAREREAGERDFPYDYEDFEQQGDYYGNFYGERQRQRLYGEDSNAPGGYFSARRDPGRGGQRRAGGSREEGSWGTGGDPGGYGQGDRGQGARDLGPGSRYDMDPGYSYEFGTRWDFDRDAGYGDQRGAQNYGERRQIGRGTPQARRESYGRGQMEDWQTPGPYTGVGPRGYRRSDERIQEQICEVFTRHGKIDARGVDIKVQDGNVSLSGEVNRKLEKYLAEEIAASISGVNEVENRLRVKR